MDGSSWLTTFDGMGFAVMRYLFSVLWQSSILFVLSGIVVYALRRCKKTVHFTIWTGTLFLFPLLPLVSSMLSSAGAPHKEVPVLPLYTSRQIVSEQESVNTGNDVAIISEVRVLYKEEKGTVSRSSQSFPVRFYKTITSAFDYPWVLVFLAYAACVLLYLLRIVTGIRRVRGWVCNGKTVDGRFHTLFDDIRQRLGILRDVRIVESEKASVPVTFQTFNPVIIMPEGFMEGLSDTELKAVAVHELVHVARNDSFIMTLGSLVKAFFFFHPLVRYTARELSYLAETIADTAVLETTEKPQSYAHFVSQLAENLPKRSYAAEYTAGIVLTRSVFFRRIKAILSHGNSKVRRLTAVSFAGVVLAMGLSVWAALALPLGDRDSLSDGTVEISGKVVFDGSPVGGVDIYRHKLNTNYKPDLTERIARTGRDGLFQAVVDTLTNNTALNVIIAYKQGYAIGIKPLNLVINDDDTIKLGKETVMSGLVKDTDNYPVQNATVTAIQLEVGKFHTIKHHLFVPSTTYLWNKNGNLPGLTVKTDKNGKFTLLSLPHVLS